VGEAIVGSRARYGRVAVALHWLIAAAIAGQILFGRYLHLIPRGTPERSLYVNLHKSIGLTLGVAILLRVYWRLTHAPPPLPASMPAWERAAARASHLGLYACMLVMPVTGYVASNFSKYGVRFFNAVLLPPWGVDDPGVYAFFKGVHVATSYVFIALITLHVLAALRHAALRDGIFARMWPGRRRVNVPR